MVNEEKTKLMAKCAIYEKHEGKREIEDSKYTKRTYILINMLKIMITWTIGFAMLAIVYSFYNINSVIKRVYSLDIENLAKDFVLVYLIMLLLLFVFAYFIYSKKYETVQAKLEKYKVALAEIKQLNIESEIVEDLSGRRE